MKVTTNKNKKRFAKQSPLFNLVQRLDLIGIDEVSFLPLDEEQTNIQIKNILTSIEKSTSYIENVSQYIKNVSSYLEKIEEFKNKYKK